MTKPFIYIASPYTKGDQALNVRVQMEAFVQLMDAGAVPFAPLLSHFIHMSYPRTYSEWLDYDIEILDMADAIVVLNAVVPEAEYVVTESSGRDTEHAYAVKAGIRVFKSVEGAIKWVKATA